MTTEFILVTSYDEEGKDLYGDRCLASLKKHWPTPIHVMENTPTVEQEDGLTKYSRLEEEDMIEFDRLYGHVDGKGYRFQASKFSRKVFVISSERFPKSEWRIWLDADTVVTGDVTLDWLRSICSDDADLVFLGRTDWHHSECGFVAYRTGNPKVLEFLKTFRDIYASGEVFDYQEWHDSYIFDRVRELHPLREKNLSEGLSGLHVWPKTVLGEKMTHLKGSIKYVL